MIFLAWANLFLAFLLEMAALFILGYWGFHLAFPGFWKWLPGIGAPLIFLTGWSLWAAPKAKHRLKGLKLWTYKIAAFSLAALALAACGESQRALLFEGIALANIILLRIWQRFEPA
jgi:hypothetical protein